ncbi:MAG: 4Fe-4S binding protein [Gammaproteobacteria bacterium]|nr:4Fe-4S binding protein [Gammaproteobacteria bacterium]
MSEIVPYKGGKTATRGYKARVVSLEFAPGKATKVRLENKLVGSGVCLGCEAPRCKTKDAEELALPALLSAFPGDPSFAVCPTSAIDVSDTSGVAVVDSKKCIGCGLCVVRCPYGAISMYSDGTVSVATADPDGLTTPTPVPADTPNPLRSGRIGVLAGDRAQQLLAASTKLADSDRNLFVRNLLHEVGLLARVRRRGDVNVRIDAVGSSKSGRIFVAEIELVGGELEVPRALLEDVAILHARYGIPINEIDVLSVISSFPSSRSEYYQVIRDIQKVLGVSCKTLTIGALLALVWAGKKLSSVGGSAFRVEEGGIDLAKSLDLPGQSEPYPGAFTPAK